MVMWDSPENDVLDDSKTGLLGAPRVITVLVPTNRFRRVVGHRIASTVVARLAFAAHPQLGSEPHARSVPATIEQSVTVHIFDFRWTNSNIRLP